MKNTIPDIDKINDKIFKKIFNNKKNTRDFLQKVLNILLFTALVLMKAAFKNDTTAVREIFEFWSEKGLLENKKKVLFFLAYIIHTQEMDQGKLNKMLEESKIEGGDYMPTLAQQLLKEGEKKGIKEGIKETARRMLFNNFSVAHVITATGLTEKEIKKLMN